MKEDLLDELEKSIPPIHGVQSIRQALRVVKLGRQMHHVRVHRSGDPLVESGLKWCEEPLFNKGDRSRGQELEGQEDNKSRARICTVALVQRVHDDGRLAGYADREQTGPDQTCDDSKGLDHQGTAALRQYVREKNAILLGVLHPAA